MANFTLSSIAPKPFLARLEAARRPLLAWGPLVAMIVLAHVLLLGQFIVTPGLPRGGDMAVNMVGGYVAQNGTWHQLWDDSRYPSQTKNVSRFSLSDLAFTEIVRLTGDLFFSMRFMVWALHIVGMVGMYLFVWRITGSRVAGALAGLVFVFSRGAPFRAVMAMMAGFALIPFVFLAVDRFLVGPSLRRGVVLALVLALYATSSIPAFTYILALAMAVYAGAFFVARGAEVVRRRESLSPLLKATILGGLAIGLTVLLSAYFLAGLSLSIIPLVEESGGYGLNYLSSIRPSFVEALLFYRGLPSENSLAMDVAIWMLALSAFGVLLMRVHWRVVALALIAIGGLYFASNSTSPVYTFLYDHLPYFSSVRGTRRWTALPLFSFSVLVGIGIAVGWERWKALARNKAGRRVWQRRAFGAAAVGLAAVACFNVVAQLPALRAWLEPYQLSQEYVAPYLWLKENTPPETVYATTPFLTSRIRGDSYLQGVASGKMAGPGISGRPAFGVFRTGGEQVNQSMQDMVIGMKGFKANQFEALEATAFPISLTIGPDGLPSKVKDFYLSGALTTSETQGPDSMVQVQFRRIGEEGEPLYYAFEVYPQTGIVELKRVGGSTARTLASSTLPPSALEEFEFALIVQDNDMEAQIDGETVLVASASGLPKGDVAVLSRGVDAIFSELELNELKGVLHPDYSLARLLGLFNVRYMVVQPHTGEFERQRIERLPGLTEVGRWGESVLYENAYYRDGKALLTPTFGLYAGDPVSAVHGLYQYHSVARAQIPLVGLRDLPPDQGAQMLQRASFLVVEGTSELTPEDAALLEQSLNSAQSAGAGPPLAYSWDLSARGTVETRKENVEPLAVLGNQPSQLGRGKNLVLEGTLQPPDAAHPMGVTRIRFRTRNDATFYEAVIDPSQGVAKLEISRRDKRDELAQASIPKNAAAPLPIRLAAIEDTFTLYVNAQQVLQAKDTRIDKGGPILIISEGDGAVMLSPRLTSRSSSLDFIQAVAQSGFSLNQIARNMENISAEDFGDLGYTQFYTTKLPQTKPGTYRLLVMASSPNPPVVDVWLANQGNVANLKMEAPRLPSGPWLHPKDTLEWLVLSEPVSLTSAETRLVVASPDSETRLVHMLLAESSQGQEEGVLGLLLGDSHPGVDVPLARKSADQYSATLAGGQGGLLVFKDAYHAGWRASLGDQRLPHFQAFGTLNGYWVEPGAADASDLKLEFMPQRRYQRGLMVSALTFATVVVGLTLVGGWGLWGRRLAGGRGPRGWVAWGRARLASAGAHVRSLLGRFRLPQREKA